MSSAVIPVPSHYFIVLLRCDNSTSCASLNYDTEAFLLPQWQTPGTTNCFVSQHTTWTSTVVVVVDDDDDDDDDDYDDYVLIPTT